MTTIEQRIKTMIEDPLKDEGYEVVRVLLQGGDKRQRLQIMVERHDGAEITVEDCTMVSRKVSMLMDVEDPIKSPYVLEVSSPGIDRPLTRLEDFERFKGHEASLELHMMMFDRKRLKGKLEGINGTDVILSSEGETATIAFDNIAKAKLILTDELIRETLRNQKKRSEEGE